MARATRTDGWESANSCGAIGHWRLSRMLERSDISGRDAVSVRHRVPAISFSREWVEEQEEGRRRKQEKGTVSRQVPSVCLHIVFLGDMALVPRDMFARNGGRSEEHTSELQSI